MFISKYFWHDSLNFSSDVHTSKQKSTSLLNSLPLNHLVLQMVLECFPKHLSSSKTEEMKQPFFTRNQPKFSFQLWPFVFPTTEEWGKFVFHLCAFSSPFPFWSIKKISRQCSMLMARYISRLGNAAASSAQHYVGLLVPKLMERFWCGIP